MIRMTWPQYLRGDIEVDGRVLRLSIQQCEIASVLLMRSDPVPTTDIIEALWLNPDHEPDWAKSCVEVEIYRMRQKGIPIVNEHGRGYRL